MVVLRMVLVIWAWIVLPNATTVERPSGVASLYVKAPNSLQLAVYNEVTYEIAALLSARDLGETDLDTLHLARIIQVKSDEIGVDPYLILAMIHIESTFNPCARSRYGAQGLMQVMPRRILGRDRAQAHLAFRAELPYDPDWNIHFGIDYLGTLIERFGRLETAIAAYNAGPTRIARLLRHDEHGFFSSYAHRVMRHYERLRIDQGGN